VTVRISDEERRRRLVSRHHLDGSVTDPVAMASAVAALHSSDPTTPYLSARARIPGFAIGDLDRDLYDRRTLIRMHTIRRTLFVLPDSDVPVFEAGATREIARKERARLVGWLSAEMDDGQVGPWLEELGTRVIEVLKGSELSTREIGDLVPDLTREMTVGSGKWATRFPVSSRLLLIMAMEGSIVRTRPAGTWRSSQYRWALMDDWRLSLPMRLEEDQARSQLAHRYLATHGPVTMIDLRWWTGWTLKSSKDALSDLEVDTVALDSGEPGLVLSGDIDADPASGAGVAFLPALDSTTMGWKERHWYLGPHGGELFDTNGNAGPTVWVNGRVAGGWAQDPDGRVVYELLGELTSEDRALVDAEAVSLSGWLDGEVVMPRFPSPLGRLLSRRGAS
jgi:hypothetical protein